MTRKQEYVIFLSPGTLFDEVSTKSIATRDLKLAVKLAKEVTERYGAKPYGFCFETHLEAGTVRDSEGKEFETVPKTIDSTGTYYIAGKVRTRDTVAHDGKASEGILLSNMQNAGWEIVCETNNGYQHTGIFGPHDVVVDWDGNIIERGEDRKYVEYRGNLRKLVVGAPTEEA